MTEESQRACGLTTTDHWMRLMLFVSWGIASNLSLSLVLFVEGTVPGIKQEEIERPSSSFSEKDPFFYRPIEFFKIIIIMSSTVSNFFLSVVLFLILIVPNDVNVNAFLMPQPQQRRNGLQRHQFRSITTPYNTSNSLFRLKIKENSSSASSIHCKLLLSTGTS